ncbi:hypothetical protein K402DRAFT_419290 [Aulographum hederae CBS 113979]|uniref:Tat pathway signal sequence n=1 Tax=Aulographum hederae CBS 113979 TaxID=1176131 RepID=A0A6G1H5D2_9PEZI|nr:hypothetical protein K402DRAFT_419290 [Aulographum hederae CBS 113979]
MPLDDPFASPRRSHLQSSIRQPTSPKRISTPAGERLSVIMESGQPPARSSNRTSRVTFPRLSFGETLRSSGEHTRLGNTVSIWSGATLNDGKKQSGLHSGHTSSRGGWKRLALLIALVVVVVIALAVGLGVGLTQRKSDSNSEGATRTSDAEPASASDSSPSPGTPNDASAFPIGSFSMVTFLDTVQTDCTSNPATWTCYPYTTYNDDHTRSKATFDWIISTGSDEGSYQISSTDNPFSIPFSNTPLDLVREGQDDEHYRFQITMDKAVIPAADISGDNSASACYYNATTFQANLYTKMERNYPPASESSNDNEWPFAVKTEQVIGGGDDTPNCYRTRNGKPTTRITSGLEAQAGGELCSCLYRNWVVDALGS